MRYFPQEIEADLLALGIDIFDWWRRTRRPDGSLVLSSRRLEVLVMKLHDESAFKQEYRQDWSMKQYLQAAQINELRISRAEQAVFHDREYREPVLLKSPTQAAKEAVEAQKKHAVVSSIAMQLRGARPPEELNKTE